MNRITAQGLVMELRLTANRRAAIITEHPRHVADVFTALASEWNGLITLERRYSAIPTIKINRRPDDPGVLHIIDERRARLDASLRGLQLDIAYIDYDIDTGSDFYRELLAPAHVR
ncbi:hypothetical protein IU449_26775 [Nocardia higoensis]|uniref:Uncharacterized protein n=1 Tax=Nocardia higoensis TaxID=228599 RepID=A0ABS0DI18_9NOCA|nr:hypothetical protein [Nocardia higoensis]MBF6358104.1 hypothetical protein [Nocardia higoensis]